jgi:flagellar FliL protein
MADEAGKTEAGGKRGKRGIVIAVAAVLVLAAGGAGAWYFLGRTPAGEAAPQAAAPARKPGVFVDLDPFTVNLADPGGERFAQVGLVVELADGGLVETLKQDMPRLRNGILLLLSSKQGDELLTVEGKKTLAAEIAALAAESAGWSPAGGRPNPVAAVHFSKFIVQ